MKRFYLFLCVNKPNKIKKMKIKAPKDMWFIIDGENKHHGKLEKGRTLETILEVKTFETEEEWKAELEKLGLSKGLSKA